MKLSKSKITIGLLLLVLAGVVIGCHTVSAKVISDNYSQHLLNR